MKTLVFSMIILAVCIFSAQHKMDDWREDVRRCATELDRTVVLVNVARNETFCIGQLKDEIYANSECIAASENLKDVLLQKPFGFSLSLTDKALVESAKDRKISLEARSESAQRTLMRIQAEEAATAERERRQAEQSKRESEARELAREEAERAARVEANRPGSWMFDSNRKTSLDR